MEVKETETAAKGKEGAAKGKEAAVKSKEAAGQEKRAAVKSKEAAGKKKKVAAKEKEAAGKKKEAAGKKKEAAGKKKEAAPKEKEAADKEKGLDFHSLSPLASGRTAEVFVFGDERVVKLFRPGIPRRLAERERRNTAAAWELGLPAPKPGDVLRMQNQYGLVLQRLEGPTLLEQMTAFARDDGEEDKAFAQGAPSQRGKFGPELEGGAHDGSNPMAAAARLLADLHGRIHRCAAPAGLPSQKEGLADAIREDVARFRKDGAEELSDDVLAQLLARLGRLPDGERLCHGDFHPDNVVVTDRGPFVIDWLDATRGRPLADVARTSLILLETAQGLARASSTSPPQSLPKAPSPPLPKFPSLQTFSSETVKAFHRLYLERRLGRDPQRWREWEGWMPIVAAARLIEVDKETRRWLVRQILIRLDP